MGEDQQKYKKVVNAQRLFDQIAREKRRALSGPNRKYTKKLKQKGNGYPKNAEQQGLFKFYWLTFTMKEPPAMISKTAISR